MMDVTFDSDKRLLKVEASGEISHEDYDKHMVPAVVAATKTQGRINLIYLFGAGFTGIAPRAMWDDARLGLHHLHDFRRIAVVTDNGLMQGAVRAFSVMMPAEVRVFDISDADEAESWATAA